MLLLSISCKLSIPKALALIGPHCILPRPCELDDVSETKADHSTKSGLRLAKSTSVGKPSLWPKSTTIIQSHALSSCLESGFDMRSLAWPSSSQINAVVGWRKLLKLFCQLSHTAASHCSTLLWHQVYLPWVRLVLQPTRMCLVDLYSFEWL